MRLMTRMEPVAGYLVMRGWQSLARALAFVMFMPYQVLVIGMNPFQLVIAGTILEATYFLFEIPTGVVADMHSRRLSMVIGFALLGGGMILAGGVPLLGVFLLSQVILALGFTFISGAAEAWIVDEAGEERSSEAFLRGSQVDSFAGIVGIIAAAPLAVFYAGLPLIIGGGAMVALGAFIALALPEEGFTPASHGERTTRAAMTHTAREGVTLIRASSLLMVLVIVSFFTGLFSEGYDRLWTAHLLENFTLPALHLPLIGAVDQIVWFSLIGVVSSLLAIAATEALRRYGDIDNERRAMLVLTGLFAVIVASLLAFALSRAFWVALASMWVLYVARYVRHPVFVTWINKHIKSEVRATVISMTGQADAIGQIAGGPAIGWIGTVRTIRTALVTSALILLPVLPLIGGAGGRLVKQAALVESSSAAE